MTCQSCKKDILHHTKNVCPKCGGDVAVKPKAKMGRPVTKTPEQREAKRRQWFIDNADSRRKYQREYQRNRRARIKAENERNER